jgi:ATP-dependent Clp protease ATP-binding subunit ClpB
MTSNVGSQYMLELDDEKDADRMAAQALRETFRPEFLNRVDAVLMFHRLTRGDIRGIVDIQLERVRALLEQRSIGLDLTDSAKDRLAEVGYDPVYGARPLKRAMQELVLEPLSEKVIAGEVRPGDRVVVDFADDKLELHTVAAAAA